MAAENNILDWTGNFIKGFVGQRPVFAQGKQIGYFTDTGTLCNGSIMIYPGNEGIPATLWTTKDDAWNDVSVSDFCVGKGLAPKWLSATDVAAIQANNPAVTYDNLVAKVEQGVSNTLSAPFAQASDTLKWVAIGGIGIIAMILILRRR